VFDDSPFDVTAVEAGSWAPGPYGPDDRLGSYNEVTPQRAARALALLDTSRPVVTFDLGETLFNGFPAFGTRRYEQHLVVGGYRPRQPFEGEVLGRGPRGANRLSYHEERVTTTYNLGTKINGLHHCGVGEMFYNGLRGPDLARSWGTAELDTAGWPALCTRGLLVDVLALKLAEGPEEHLTSTSGGLGSLHDDYRITLEDLEAAVERQDLPAFEPGDAVLIRTGWRRMLREEPERYLAGGPGPYVRECRWLASSRPALVGADTWGFEAIASAVRGGTFSMCHQELLMRYGVRIAEGLQLDDLAQAGVDRFVFCHSPLRAVGATASNSPPMAIANVR